MTTVTDLTPLALDLHKRIVQARAETAVYFDSTGTFRASPAKGARCLQAFKDFPDCILGIYTPKVAFDFFEEDFYWFCEQMGYEAPKRYERVLRQMYMS